MNPGSGNGLRKNDVRTEDLSVELKWTGKRQFTLKADELEKAEREAIKDGRESAFGISLGGRNYVILVEGYFEELRDGSA